MRNAKIRILIFISGLLLLTLPFTGSDCNSSNNPPAPSTGGVAAPVNVSVVINSDSTGQHSTALINWDASPDENLSNFRGYKVATYKVDANHNVLSTHEVRDLSYPVHYYTVDSLALNTRYESFVISELNDGSEGDSAGTLAYAGIYQNTDGTIDEYQQEDSIIIKSGYGWNIQTGEGTNYFFNSSNADMIDMIMRDGVNDSLTFYSPDKYSPGTKTTKIIKVGPGQDAFDQTYLSEPDMDSVRVDSNYVYLLKTMDGYYIKIWVKAIHYIAGAIPPYHNVVFDYKVQPIEGLKVL